MKRILLIILIVLLITPLVYINASAENIIIWCNNVPVEVNGITIASAGYDYTDANGKSFPISLLYADTHYLPIRAFAEMFNKDVNFSAEDCEIFLTSKGGPAPEIKENSPSPKSVSTIEVEAALNCFSVSVDGKRVISKGEKYTCEDTKIPSSLVIKGITYLPINKVGEILDQIVAGYSNLICVGSNKYLYDYADFPGIPDFSSISSWPRIDNSVPIDVGPYYCATYEYENLYLRNLVAYRQILTQNGFRLTFALEKSPSFWYTYVNPQTSQALTLVAAKKGFSITCMRGIPIDGYYPEFPTVIDYGMRKNYIPDILTNTDIDYYNHFYVYSIEQPDAINPIILLRQDGFKDIDTNTLKSLNIPIYSSDALAVKKDNIIVVAYTSYPDSSSATCELYIVCIDISYATTNKER